MDVNDLRCVVTVLSLVAFVLINVWVFAPRRKGALEEAAVLALRDEDTPGERP